MKVKQNTLLRSFVVVAFCFSALGLSAQSVTKTFKKESLANVLKEVERQTGMSVIYKVDEVNANKKITASFQSTPLREVLESDRKSTRLNSSHANISYAVFCLKKK